MKNRINIISKIFENNISMILKTKVIFRVDLFEAHTKIVEITFKNVLFSDTRKNH
jgi:hypothetical protein